MFKHLHCPHCNLPLFPSDGSMRCDNAHCFDIAKEGYLNLLPVQAKRSKQPGDSLEMVLARRDWLNRGHYNRLIEEINLLLDTRTTPMSYLDLCCGEGFYTSRLALNAGVRLGIDISKFAARAAAKQYRDVDFLVASTRNLPIDDDSYDLVTCLFGFYDLSEIRRVLKDGGQVVLVHTGQNHLIELRREVYNEVKASEYNLNDTSGFKVESHTLSYTIDCTSDETISLLNMTPHGYRVAGKQEKLDAIRQVTRHTLDFRIFTLKG